MEFLVIVLLVLILGLGGWLAFVEYRYRKLARSFSALMTGRSGADLEATLLDFVSRMDRVEQVTQSMDHRVGSVQAKLPYLIQHIGVVRFNPFADKGGDQSFALAILDDHADGAVISSLHSRVDVRIYAKPIVGGQSTYSLSADEKEAIARAMKPRM